jgi:hypothetical protein
MKKMVLLIAMFAFFTSSFAAIGNSFVPKKATEIYLSMAGNRKISLKDLSEISVKDYQQITGKHLNFFEKITFKIGQKKLRNSISADGTITNKKLLKAMVSDGDHSTGFHVGGFALGLFLGLIGVLIAYVAGGDDDVKRNRAKWAWIGLGLSVIISVILVLTIKAPVY